MSRKVHISLVPARADGLRDGRGVVALPLAAVGRGQHVACDPVAVAAHRERLIALAAKVSVLSIERITL